MPKATPQVRVRTITPTEAQKLLDSQIKNRTLRKRRVDQIASDITAGRFVLNGETIKVSSKGVLLDGQHRLAGCIKANKSFTTYVVEGLADSLVPTIDQGAARSNQDVLKMDGVPNCYHAATMARHLWQFDTLGTMGVSVMPSRHVILEVYDHYSDQIQESLSKASKGNKTFSGLPRSSGALAYMLIARKNNGKADQFLEALADEEDTSPALLAARRFLRNRKNRGQAVPRQVVPVLIKAYNAWRKKQNVQVLQHRADEYFPEVES